MSENKDTRGGIYMVPSPKELLIYDVEKAGMWIRNVPASFETSHLVQMGAGEANIFYQWIVVS